MSDSLGPDAFQHFEELPYRRYLDVLRNRVNDLRQKLGRQANFDQYPGKTVPWAFSKLYGPINFAAPRHFAGATGFDALAPLVTPAQFILPRATNILTGRDAAFYWCASNVSGYVSWTYVSDPGFAVPINARAPADIFDRAIENNGGAIGLNNFAFTIMTGQVQAPRICFEIDLYDRKRGRSLTEGKIPAEAFLGLAFDDKKTFAPMRFDPDTEIEPRLYVTEARLPFLTTNQAFNAARAAFYLTLTFKGYNALEEGQGQSRVFGARS